MTFRVPLNRKHFAAVFGVVLAAGIGLVLHEFKVGRGLVDSSYDLLLVARGNVRPDDAVLVYLDDDSHLKLGQSYTAPWDRSLHARLIDRITAAGARAIVFDIVFSDPNSNNVAADEALAKATKQSGRVLLAADLVPVPGGSQAVPPFALLLDGAVDIGTDEFVPDADLAIRRHTRKGDRALSSLSWSAAAFLKAKAIENGGSEDAVRWINYYGPPNWIPWVSYIDALDPARVPDAFFKGKAVFVGARILTRFAGQRKDEYPNPFSFWVASAAKFTAGAEIQATVFLNLLRGDWLQRLSGRQELWWIAILGILFGWGLIRLHPVWASGAALLGMAGVFAVSYVLFREKLIWFPWLILIVQICVALAWSIVFNSIQLYVEKRLYEQTLRLYLPPKLVRKFAKSRALLKPGAEKQTLTLFFSDIADFTTVSEGMDSDALADMMNSYFENAVAKCVHKADGTVAKYIGDSIFAFWNAPDAQADHPLLACEAALLFREQAAQPVHGRMLRTRMGIHTGQANVGNFGSEQRVDYTALGENVNLASRLEGLNKYLGTDCLISGETKLRIGDRFLTRSLGSFQLKGFENLVAVHELLGQPEQAQATLEWRQAFAEALNNYEQRNLEFAEAGFRHVLELKANDGPSKFYLERITELSKQALPENWATHTILKEK